MVSRSGDKYPPDWDTRRRRVYQRDGYACQDCGVRGGPHGNVELHCHHIIPISEGGSHALSNLTTLCWRCHDAVHDHHIPRMSDVRSSDKPESRILDDLQSELDPADYTPESQPYVRYWRDLLELFKAISALDYTKLFSLQDITNDWYHYTRTYQQLPRSHAVQQFDAELHEIERVYSEIDDAYMTFINQAATLPEKPPACTDAERYVSGVVNEIDSIITHANGIQSADDIDELQHHYEKLINSSAPTTPPTVPEAKQKVKRILRELETTMRQRMEPAKDPVTDLEQSKEDTTTFETDSEDNITQSNLGVASEAGTDTASEDNPTAGSASSASQSRILIKYNKLNAHITIVALLLLIGIIIVVVLLL